MNDRGNFVRTFNKRDSEVLVVRVGNENIIMKVFMNQTNKIKILLNADKDKTIIDIVKINRDRPIEDILKLTHEELKNESKDY